MSNLPKRPSAKSELAFFLALFLVFWLAIIKSLAQTHISLIEGSVIISSAAMMFVIKRRVLLAIHGAVKALEDGEPASIQSEQERLSKGAK